jgi:4-hydroxy-tetrahydrodipicolinate synthase
MTAAGGGRPLAAFVCTITPFDESGALDENGIIDLCRRLGDAGIGAYLGSASPGEGYALSLAETGRFYELALDAAAGRIPVRGMGVEPHTPSELQPLIELAQSVGLDAMQLYAVDAGHSNKLTPGEIERYYRDLLEGMRIDAVLSSHVFNGLLSLELIGALLDDYPHIVAINCTSPELGYLSQLIELVDGRVDIHVGGPMQALTAVALGAQGFLCTEGNLAPKLCRAVIDAMTRGDLEAAFAHYRQIIRLSSINRWPGGSMRFLKTAMKILDLPGWHLRPPFAALDAPSEAHIANGLRELGIDEWGAR